MNLVGELQSEAFSLDIQTLSIHCTIFEENQSCIEIARDPVPNTFLFVYITSAPTLPPKPLRSSTSLPMTNLLVSLLNLFLAHSSLSYAIASWDGLID
jgi:hypothetical protein